jgi:Ala-tRNA(Pro) deacylase
MAISEKLNTFLQASKVKYTVAKHPVVYTAQEIAAAQHVPGRQLAKCVLVKTDRGPILAVLPAIHLVDLKKLKTLLRVKTLTIAKEADIKERFPDVEVGAMSPFGNLYQVPVVVDRVLGESEEIICNAGSHTDTIKMRYRDFATLANPQVGAFGQHVGGQAVEKKSRSKTGRRQRPRPSAARRARVKSSSRPRTRSKDRR